MSLFKLPPELRNQILSDCMWDLHDRSVDTKMRHCFEYPEWQAPPPDYLTCRTDFENGQATHSDLWRAMTDLDVEGLLDPSRASKKDGEYRNLPVLYVCRDWYRAAIPLWYSQYTFAFKSASALRHFSNNAREMYNNEFVRDIRITVNAWDWSECQRFGGRGPYAHVPDWEEWMQFFEEEGRGLLWHFPGLKMLRIDFVTDKEHSLFGDYHDDGGEFYHPEFSLKPLRFYESQQGFECFQSMLRTNVRVQKVEVEGLHNPYTTKEMEWEMMGLGNFHHFLTRKTAEWNANSDAV